MRVDFTDPPLELACLNTQQDLFLAEDTPAKNVVASVSCLSSYNKQDVAYRLLADSGKWFAFVQKRPIVSRGR